MDWSYKILVNSLSIFLPHLNRSVAFSFRFLTYLSAICEDDVQGKKLLHAAINVLFHIPVSGGSGNNNFAEDQSETGDAKPALLWSVLYTQELAKVSAIPFYTLFLLYTVALPFCFYKDFPQFLFHFAKVLMLLFVCRSFETAVMTLSLLGLCSPSILFLQGFELSLFRIFCTFRYRLSTYHIECLTCILVLSIVH